MSGRIPNIADLQDAFLTKNHELVFLPESCAAKDLGQNFAAKIHHGTCGDIHLRLRKHGRTLHRIGLGKRHPDCGTGTRRAAEVI